MPEKVIRLIHKHSHGIPRLINIICDRALLGAYAENKVSIDTKIAKKAVQEVVAAQKTGTVSSMKIFVTAVLLLLLLFIPAYLLFYGGGGNLEKQLKRLLPAQISAEQQVPAPPATH
jgi:general secretion pathway protein A